jgi:hypothetical protein
MDSLGSNISDNGDGKVKEIVMVPEDDSTTQSDSIKSSQFQVDNKSNNANSTVISQPLYKSYRDFIEHNKENKTDINESNNTISSKSIIESSSASASSSQVTAQSTNKVYGDFNGDGFDDLAIRVAFEDIDTSAGTQFGAGAVHVIYGSSDGLSATSPRLDQFWTQSTTDVNDVSETDDFFCSSLASGDFNGDGRDDVAIGVPSEDLETGAGTIGGAGAVNVIYGSSNGLSATSPIPDQFWTQSTTDVNDVSETNDNFGRTLTAGDFNGDGKDDLAIGVPGEARLWKLELEL